MKILIISATKRELDSVLKILKHTPEDHSIEAFVTGVGMIATSFALGKKLSEEQYDLAINIGIAGAFDRKLQLGEVIEVVEDQFAEEIVQDDKVERTFEEIGLRKQIEFPFKNGVLCSTFQISNSTLKKVRGITVNTVHGNETSIKKVEERLNPQVESMEGAAFLYACNCSRVPCLQIRAISNYVEKRNRENWKIELALNNLAKEFQTLLKQL